MKSYALTLSLLALFSLSKAQLPSYLPDSGLVSWYPFNGNANDESTNSNNGTLNGPVLTSDRFGNTNSAYNFDGTNDYIFIAGNAQFNTLGSVTVSAWYNTSTSTSARTLMTQSDLTAAGERFTMRLNLAQVKNASTCAAGVWGGTGNHPYNTNSWSHYVFTFDQDKVRVYLDGSAVDSSDVPNGPLGPCSNSPLKFGMHWNGDPQWFLGKLDDIAIWDRALSLSEIQQLYGAVDGELTQSDTALCSGDSLMLEVEGNGITGYSWSTGDTTQSIIVNPTSDSTYFVTIENAFGTLIDSVAIQVSDMQVDFIAVAPECSNSSNGSIQVVASGGLGAYSYLWSNSNTTDSLSGLMENTGFEVTVTDSLGCTTTDSVYVPEHLDTIAPTLIPMLAGLYYLNEEGIAVVDPQAHDNGSTDNCGDVSLFVTPSDTLDCDNLSGPAFYSLYAMDADSNISDPGNLSVVTMDTLPPTIVDCPSNDTICQGDAISSAVEFDYSDNCEVVNVTYNGPETDSIEVPADTTLVQEWIVEDQSGNVSVCSRNLLVQYAPPVRINYDVGLEGSSCYSAKSEGNPTSFSWMNGDTSDLICITDSQWVWVVVNYANGCSRIDSAYGTVYAGINEQRGNNVSVYPNPAFDVISISSPAESIIQWELISMEGRTIIGDMTASNLIGVDVSAVPVGVYFVRVVTDGALLNRRVVISK